MSELRDESMLPKPPPLEGGAAAEGQDLPDEGRETAQAAEGIGEEVENSPAGPAESPPHRGGRKKKPPKAEQPPKKKSALKAFLWLVVKLAIVAGLAYLALLYVFGVFRMSGNNMYPMLKDGDLIVTYKLEEYHSQDIVAYRVDDETVLFGRIVARAGDTVDGDEMGLFLNGGRPSEEIFYPTQIQDTALELPITLEEGQYVILNDFREDQGDSRFYGVISEESFEGKVCFIFRRRGF